VIRALGAADAVSVRRDSLLRGMVVVPLALAAAVRWVAPAAAARMGALLGIDLAAVYPPLFGYILLLLPAAICGMVVGFLLLDQRDEQTLRALQVTPLPLWGYVAYRLAAPMLLSVAMTIVALPLSGVVALGPAALLAVALAAAPIAPAVALFLAAFAANKVQGFALQKVMGVFLVVPALAPFLPMPWPVVAACLPTFWPAALLWQTSAGGATPWGLFALGLLYQAVLLALLLRRFNVLMTGR